MPDQTLEARVSAIEKWIEQHDKEKIEELKMELQMAKIKNSMPYFPPRIGF